MTVSEMGATAVSKEGTARCSKSRTWSSTSPYGVARSSGTGSGSCTRCAVCRSASRPGETLGLVGESGCGKSTTGRSVLQLIEADIGLGQVRRNGTDGARLGRHAAHAPQIQVVFQDPFASLDPRLPVGEAIAEPLPYPRHP